MRIARSLRGTHQKTLGADKGYDTREFVADLRINGITPHVAQNLTRSGGDFQERYHSSAATRAARIKGSSRIGLGSSIGLLIQTSSG